MVLKKFHQDTTKLVPGDLKLISPKELSQYYIEDTKLLYFSPGRTEIFILYYFVIKLDNHKHIHNIKLQHEI